MSFWDEGPSKKVRIIIFLSIGCLLPGIFIGPLLSMVLRASGEQTEERYSAICLSRLRKIGTAMAMYGEDNDGRFPYSNAWIDGTWHYILKRDPMETTENFYQCPTISKLRTGEFGFAMNDLYGQAKIADFAKESDGGKIEPLVFDSDEVGRNAHSNIGSLGFPPRHMNFKLNNGLFPDLSAKPIQSGDYPTAPPAKQSSSGFSNSD